MYGPKQGPYLNFDIEFSHIFLKRLCSKYGGYVQTDIFVWKNVIYL